MTAVLFGSVSAVAKILAALQDTAGIFGTTIERAFSFFLAGSTQKDAFGLTPYTGKPEDAYLIVDFESIHDATAFFSQEFAGVFIHRNGAFVNCKDTRAINVLQQRNIMLGDLPSMKHMNAQKIIIDAINHKTEVTAYPKLLQLEHTTVCNAECIMCSHYITTNTNSRHIRQDLVQKLEPIFPYCEAMIINGYGEPFLVPGLENFLYLYRSYGIHLSANTNLSFLSDALLRAVSDTFHSLRVSCDGCTAEVYEGVRRGLSFDTFVKNAERLAREAPGLSKTMSVVAMRQNVHQLADMVRFAHDLGFSEITFSRLGANPLLGNEHDQLFLYPLTSARAYDAARDMGEKLKISVVTPKYDSCAEGSLEEEARRIQSRPMFPGLEHQREAIRAALESTGELAENESRWTTDLKDCDFSTGALECRGICEWVLEQPYIDLHGNVYVCGMTPNYRIGNIYEASDFMDIWNSSVMQRIRQMFYDGRLPVFCNNCQCIVNQTLRGLTLDTLPPKFFEKVPLGGRHASMCSAKENKCVE